MIRNYLKTAIRNLLRYRFISFINLFGLTVGLTSCLLITMYIMNELSFDKQNSKADRTYRVTRIFYSADGTQMLHLGTIAPPFGPLIKNAFSDIEKVTMLLPAGNTPMKYGEKLFNEHDIYFADENLTGVFDINVKEGSATSGLSEPYSVMMSEEMARKYFGSEDPMNKIIQYNGQFNMKVTGVYKAFPATSHIHPSMLFSFNTLRDTAVYGEENLRTNWGNNSFLTYLLFPKNYPVKKIEAQFPGFLDRYVHFPDAPADYKTSKSTKLTLQKLTDIHLRSHLDYEAEENGDIKRVYIFAAIALFILLIASINYMNLSTARSVLRAREIGVRKAIGAQKKQLTGQFLTESVLLCFIAAILALALTSLTLPSLNKLSGLQLEMSSLLQPRIVISIILVPFAAGILSGIYPALFLSSFQPVKVLKGTLKLAGGNISFRKVLVVAQFSISIILIVSTVVVFSQLRYMQNSSLGYNKDQVVTLPYYSAFNSSYESFRNDLVNTKGIVNVCRSSRIPTGRLLDTQNASTISGDSLIPVSADIKFVAADYDFVPTYNIPVKAGRNFSRDYANDTTSFIINEASVSLLGWKNNNEAIGKRFSYAGIRGQIIGVIGDFHFESMHQKIIPLILVMPKPENAGFFGRISVKIAASNTAASLAAIEAAWKRYLPQSPYEYTFLDDNFNKLYTSEQRQASIFTIFAFIAIFIACLGLFGLSAFTISQRIKEIGIRKVLGAGTGTIVTLLSKDFLLLVAIASFISFPVAWWAMHTWLQDFAYRITIPWWAFVMAAIIAAVTAIGTVSIQAVKAALNNPVKSLRNE